MIPPAVVKLRSFTTSCGVYLLSYASLTGVYFYLTLHPQLAKIFPGRALIQNLIGQDLMPSLRARGRTGSGAMTLAAKHHGPFGMSLIQVRRSAAGSILPACSVGLQSWLIVRSGRRPSL